MLLERYLKNNSIYDIIVWLNNHPNDIDMIIEELKNLKKILPNHIFASCIYCIAKDVKNLSDYHMGILVEYICETEDAEYMYMFIRDIYIEQKNSIIECILKTGNMKYIISTAIYVDINIINGLFKTISDMFDYIKCNGIFNKDEILKLQKDMFCFENILACLNSEDEVVKSK